MISLGDTDTLIMNIVRKPTMAEKKPSRVVEMVKLLWE